MVVSKIMVIKRQQGSHGIIHMTSRNIIFPPPSFLHQVNSHGVKSQPYKLADNFAKMVEQNK